MEDEKKRLHRGLAELTAIRRGEDYITSGSAYTAYFLSCSQLSLRSYITGQIPLQDNDCDVQMGQAWIRK